MIGSFLRKAQLLGGCAATAAPDAPFGLSASGITSSAITVNFDDSTASPNKATSYEISISFDLGASWFFTATLSATGSPPFSYQFTGLQSSLTYQFRVRGLNCAGAGAYDGESFQATTSAGTANAVPSVTTGLSASAASSTQINLTWNIDATASPNQATYYEIESSTDNVLFSPLTTVNNPGTGSYSATGLSPSTQYWFRMSSCNTVGCSAKTASATATTQSATPTAAWSLDFSTGTPSGYTLTRASSGTYVDSSGYIASANTDVARLTHDSSGSRLGLLVEEQRTNFARSTENVSTNMGNVSGATRTLDDGVAPDNATTADRVELTSSGYMYKSTAGTTTAGTYTASFYIKQKSASQTVRARFATSNGLVPAASTITTSADWQRVVLTTTTSTTIALEVGIDQRTAVGGPATACDVLIWGFQIEEGATATSYIPNASTTASATRSADLAHVLDSSITNWGDPGALVIHFYAPGQAGTLISTDDAATAQVGIEASTTTAARAFWSSGSTATGTIGSGVQKAVHYWTGSTSKFCINGGTVQSGTNNLTIGNTDFVTLGAEATESGGVPGTFSQYSNCVIRKIEFYSGTLTDANLQTITT